MTYIAEDYYRKLNETSHKFQRVDYGIIPPSSTEIRLFVIARNEALRIGYFVQYYQKLGVDRIFLIDNDSTDDTVNIALSYNNVHIFTISEGYRHSWLWMQYFLTQYGNTNWCLVADVDELFYYPHVNVVSLQSLTQYLESFQYTAFACLLLDMYSHLPIKDVTYHQGEDPIQVCRYFDSVYRSITNEFVDYKHNTTYKSQIFIGGMRQRVFGQTETGERLFYLSKVPLFKNSDQIYLSEGMHAINGARMADISGIVFHTKFLCDFVAEVKEESDRGEFCQDAADPKAYHFQLNNNPDLNLKHNDSQEFKNVEQLIQLGLMHTSSSFESYVNSVKSNI
jgi:hypothetical protein